MMDIVEYTNKGKRPTNQDFGIHRTLPNQSAICVLADGMGGYSHGELASKLVAEQIVDFVERNFDIQKPMELLRSAIKQSNEALMLEKIEKGITKMGTVITTLLITQEKAYISWLGDSRIYMFRNNREVYRTSDHSVLNEVANKDVLTAQNIERFSSMVTRSVMGDPDFNDIPVKYVKIKPNDTFILCTDGFYKEIGIDCARVYSCADKEILDGRANTVADNYSFIKVDI